MGAYAYLPPAVVDALPGLTPSAARIAVAVASFMGKSGECWPGHKAIGRRAGISRLDTIRTALAELRDSGLLKVKRRRRTTALLSWQDPPQRAASHAQDPALCVAQDCTQPAASSAQDCTPGADPQDQDPALCVAQDCTQPAASSAQDRTLSVAQDPALCGAQRKCTTEQQYVRVRTGGERPPPELADLELYAADRKLCKRWPQLLRTWQRTYPWLDVMAEVCHAHAWEVENVSRRKTDRPRFLGNWLRRAEERRQRDAPVADEPPPLSTEYVDWLEADAAEWEAAHGR